MCNAAVRHLVQVKGGRSLLLHSGTVFSRMLETFSFLDGSRKRNLQRVKTAKGKHPAYDTRAHRWANDSIAAYD
jgi:hypothetical protein